MDLPVAPPPHDRRLLGILCTYRRRSEALEYLDRLEAQTVSPDVVVVVDNDDDEELEAAIAARPRRHMTVQYLSSGKNVGPAGAFRQGFDYLAREGSRTDFVALFDDDDPPVAETQLERLCSALSTAINTDSSIAGIGCSGGTLNRRTGLISRAATMPYADVDHLHGGYLPVYEMGALTEVGGQDPSFFYGFEELELGRRLRGCGRRLLVHNGLMRELEALYPKKARLAAEPAEARESAWSRFHKERNLVRILRREHLWSAIAFTCLFRHTLKPITMLPLGPRRGWDRLVLGLRATRSGLRGETGIDSRYPPPG